MLVWANFHQEKMANCMNNSPPMEATQHKQFRPSYMIWKLLWHLRKMTKVKGLSAYQFLVSLSKFLLVVKCLLPF